MSGPLEDLRAAVLAAAAAVRGGDGEGSVQPRLERPKRAGQGDYSTNAAMLLAPSLGAPPRVIAERLGPELQARLGDRLARWEVAGPGFLNLTMSDAWHSDAVRSVLAAGDAFGAGGASVAERVIVEFVSANPTGPLVAASGRHAAFGDALARILQHHGHEVWREYYFNDAGTQIDNLGRSVIMRARGEEVPADQGLYEGEYVASLAAQIPDAASREVDDVAAAAVELLIGQISATLERYGVHFDRFFSERVLHEGSPSAVQRVLDSLERAGQLYRSEGATWLRTTRFGDEHDQVVIRSTGAPTYLAGDIAYLQEKRERGFERQIIAVGADHHAYVAEMKAAMAALGGDPDRVELPILQFVHLVSTEGVLRMSKRRGDFVTLDELLDAIGVDAARYFLVQRSHDRTMELNLELARSQSAENPVYYIQYAHARIASMLAKLPSGRVARALDGSADWGAAELHPSESGLVKKLVSFPEELADAAARRAPHRIAAYALELAQEFTAFYRDCRVVGASPEPLESWRIALSVAARRTIALSLGLLGVSAPDSM
ncbi:MAG TPA: arginine--tRNA ligase [Solirubrobacteraceae bacterium]|nr:arginine--tRNA ligase [Solirubrobacteraceae bacterium]